MLLSRVFNYSQTLSTMALTTALTLNTTFAVYAQSDNSTIQDNLPQGANEILPRLDKSADLLLPDGREISIHPDSRTAAGTIGSQFFHRPINAFITVSDSKHGHAIIHDKYEDETHVYIAIRLAVSTPTFRELSRGAVIEEDPAVRLIKPEIEDREIDVRRWPLKLYRLEAKHALTGKRYSEASDLESLRSRGDELPMIIKIPSDEYEEFLINLKADRINFYPSYTFNNAIIAFGQSATTLSGEVSIAISNALSSQQLEEGGAIFQEDASKLENLIEQNIVTTIRATDQSVLAHITPKDVSSKIIQAESLKFNSLGGDEALLSSVSEYLVPIVRKMKEEYHDETTTSSTDEQNDDLTIKLGANATPTTIGNMLKTGLGISGDLTLTKKQVQTLTNVHNVKFNETEEKDVIEPHSISISTIRNGWQNDLLNIFQTIYLAVGRDNSFQQDSSFRASFTLQVLGEAIGENQIVVSPYSGVPKGVPMISFRSDIPKGWVALDGKAIWPNENWVPKHLRSKHVPDMRGAFARGAMPNELIGQMLLENTIKIPSKTIKGADFILDGQGDVSALNSRRQITQYIAEEDNQQGTGNLTGWYNRKAHGSLFYDVGKRVQGKPPQVFTVDIYKDYTIKGTHVIPEENIDLADPKHQPPHNVGLWIMRIK